MELQKQPNGFVKKYEHINCVFEDLVFKNNKLDPDCINGGANTIWPHHLREWLEINEELPYPFKYFSILPFCGYVKYYEVKEIPDSINYLYIINISNVTYFYKNSEIGFNNVSQRVIQDVKNRKAKIILLLASEGTSCTQGCEYDLNIIQKWVEQAELPGDMVYYINGNLISQEKAQQHNVSFKVEGLSSFETWNYETSPGLRWNRDDNMKNIVEFKPDSANCLYLNLNRIPRQHRVLFLAELTNKNLLNRGLNSWNLRIAPNLLTSLEMFKHVIRLYDENVVDAAVHLFNNPVYILDTDTGPNLALNLNKSLYEKTFVSIISETLIDNNSVFLSEKIWKPIITGHPFMVIGSNGLLKKLKEFGYKTFDRWFDESYDNTGTLKEKFAVILNNLKKYENMSIEELQRVRLEMHETCMHNKNLFTEKINSMLDPNGNIILNAPSLNALLKIYDNW